SARVLQAAILIGGVLALYSRVVVELVHDWLDDPAFSFGLLVPLVAVFLIWQRRRILTRIPASPSYLGFGIAVLAMLFYAAGRLGAEFYLQRISLLLLIAGLIAGFHGLRMMKALGFELILLLSAIPLPALIYNRFALPLQLLASSVATTVVQWLGI